MLEVLRKLAKKKAPPPDLFRCDCGGGSARRMEGIDKVLAPLGELPVLVHTIYSFQDCPRFDEIVVVTREDLLVEIVSRICKDFQLDKVTKAGGRGQREDRLCAGWAQGGASGCGPYRNPRRRPPTGPPAGAGGGGGAGGGNREQPPPLYRSQIQ